MAVILVVADVAGSGKTTVGKIVAQRLSCVSPDGDDFHTPECVVKCTPGSRSPTLAAVAAEDH